MNFLTLGLTLLLQPSLALSASQEVTNPWWREIVTACTLEEEGDTSAALNAWQLASGHDEAPATVAFNYGRILASLNNPDAIDALRDAALDPATEAHAQLELAKFYARQMDSSACEEALTQAKAAGLCLPKGDIANDKAFAKLKREKWFRSLLKGMEDPEQRYRQLTQSGDEEALQSFLRARNFQWSEEDEAPAYLLLNDVEDLAQAIASGKTASSEQREQLLHVARAADLALSTDAYETWVQSMLKLDKQTASTFLQNWKTIGAQGPLFRGHRFEELMRRFIPIAKSAEAMGDLLGLLCAKMVLASTRTCLVEYKVRGFELDSEWRRAWQDCESVQFYGRAFGEWDALLSAYELRVQLLGDFPSSAVRTEFLTEGNVASTYIEMTIHDLHMAEDERRIKWIHKDLRRHGLAY